MRQESHQFVEVVLPFLVPSLAGVALFLFIWLVLRQPLQKVVDRLFTADGTLPRVAKSVRVPLGPFDAGSAPGPPMGHERVNQPFELAGGAREESSSAPLDAARREHYRAELQRAEAQFVREPAEAVERAERLLTELTRERGSASVVKALMREERSRPGAVNRPTGFGGDSEFGASLADAAVGIFRLIRRERAAARGRSTAVERRGASADDFRERMDLYRGVVRQLLEAEHGELDALGAAAPAASGDDASDRRKRPHRRRDGTFVEWAAREWPFARWHVLQLLLSLALALAVLVLVLWVLSP